MYSEVQLLKTENQILKQQARENGLGPSRYNSGYFWSQDGVVSERKTTVVA